MIPEPVLEEEELAAFRRGIDEFDRGFFFECHDTLEEVWHGIRGPGRDFFQGLIQLAVGCYHHENGNLRGAKSQLEKGLARLAPYPSPYLDLDLDRFRTLALARLRTIADAGQID